MIKSFKKCHRIKAKRYQEAGRTEWQKINLAEGKQGKVVKTEDTCCLRKVGVLANDASA